MNPGDVAIVWFWLCVLGGTATIVVTGTKALCRAAHGLFLDVDDLARRDRLRLLGGRDLRARNRFTRSL